MTVEVAGANTTKAFMADKFTITAVIYRDRFIFYLKMSLNSGGNIDHCFIYFLTSMKTALKLLGSCVYFLTGMNFMLKLLEDKFACPQHNNAYRSARPPSFIAFNLVIGMKVYL